MRKVALLQMLLESAAHQKPNRTITPKGEYAGKAMIKKWDEGTTEARKAKPARLMRTVKVEVSASVSKSWCGTRCLARARVRASKRHRVCGNRGRTAATSRCGRTGDVAVERPPHRLSRLISRQHRVLAPLARARAKTRHLIVSTDRRHYTSVM